jgi:hypothetical protein
MRTSVILSVAMCLELLTGCANVVPPIQDERDLPIKFIVGEAVCEIADALTAIDYLNKGRAVFDRNYKPLVFLDDSQRADRNVRLQQYAPNSFDPSTWAIEIDLAPTSTSIYDIGSTNGYKSNPAAKKNLFQSGVAFANGGGTIPWANFDVNATTRAVVKYTVHSSALIGNSSLISDRTRYCDETGLSKELNDGSIGLIINHNVSQSLQIFDWIMRFTSPLDGKLVALTPGGNGGFTYVVELKDYYGANLAAIYGYPPFKFFLGSSAGFERFKDELLTITFIPDPKKGKGGVSSPVAATKLQIQELTNAIKALPQ